MMKRILAAVLVLMLSLSGVTAMAAEQGTGVDNQISTIDKAVEYKAKITVTADGGSFKVGFVTLQFPKGFIDGDKLPVTFDVAVNVDDGKAGITITPDTDGFNSSVKIKVRPYRGLLYDADAGKNVEVNIKGQNIKVEHFSRYAFS